MESSKVLGMPLVWYATPITFLNLDEKRLACVIPIITESIEHFKILLITTLSNFLVTKLYMESKKEIS